MKVCSKCKVEKELDKYETYYHSTQKKTWTRGYCKACMNKQKKAYKLKKIGIEYIPTYEPELPEHIKHPELYKRCCKCKEYKLKETEFYKSKTKPFGACRTCVRVKDKELHRQQMENKGGSDKILLKPNMYFDDIQKSQTFEFLALLGYLYDKATGIWYKPGIKEIVDNKPVFLKIKKNSRKYIPSPKRDITPLNKEQVESINSLYEKGYNCNQISIQLGVAYSKVNSVLYRSNYEKSINFRKKRYSKEIFDLRETGMTFKEISSKYDVSERTIRNWYYDYEEEKTK
jgi:transposase